MNVPGSNILGLALTVIAPQTPQYKAWTGLTTSASGQEVPTYAAAVNRRGSFQPVSKTAQSQMGLDMAKSYATFFGPGAVRTLERDGAPDQFIFGGRKWNAVGLVDWMQQDGWTAALCVDVGPNA